MTGLRAILVAGDYSDLLAVTLPYNRHHFDEMHIVTDEKSVNGVAAAAAQCNGPDDPDIIWHVTDLFYRDGAVFNKWRALEWGLDQMGREGWLCVMDADVLWPKGVEVVECGQSVGFNWGNGRGLLLDRGQLMTPLRRMAPWPPEQLTVTQEVWEGPDGRRTKIETEPVIPEERTWCRYPVHRNVGEWAGYSQVFHAEDPHLGPAPWHQTDWKHAGGADSLFQRKWPMSAKRRPPWEVLHLGEAGANWFGRATPYADGSVPADAAEKGAKVREIWRRRSEARRAGRSEADIFRPERLG